MIKHTIAKSLCQKWWLCVFLAVVIIAVILLSLAPAYILQALVDNVLSVNAQPDALTHLLYYAIAYFLMLALVGLFDLIKQILLVIIGENLMKDIRLAMSKKLTSINALYFSKVDSSQTTSTFVNDVDTIAVIFTDGIISMAIDLLKIIGIIASMFVFSTMLGIIAIAIVPIIYIISHAFKNKMFRSQLKNRLLVGKVNNHITQTITTRQMIKVYALEQYMSDKYQRLLNQNYDSVEKVNFLGSIYSPIVKTISAATIAIILIISGVNDSFFGITIGALAAAITLVESLFDPIDNLGMELQSLQSALSGIRRVNDFLTQPDDPAKKNITLQQIAPDGKVTLRLEDVTFGYLQDKPVLQHINLTINNGEKVTIIGRTGVGKTTLFRLLNGQYKGSGAIFINGVDVFDIDDKVKPYLLGYIQQNFYAIDGSIKDNVTLGNANLTDTAVVSALNFVTLGKTIETLPLGINTPFVDAALSQGQLQLLGIARAIIYNPKILLLDEMTANLDIQTEKQILEVLEKASDNKTILSISHRQSSVVNSDKIVTLEDGTIKNITYPKK